MIKRLRTKLVMAAMISLISVLVFIIGAASILNYQKIIRDADQKIELLLNNDAPPQQLDGKIPSFSPDRPFESSYFIVSLSADNAVQTISVGHRDEIDSETINTYVTQALYNNNTSGFVNGYRYQRIDNQLCFISCYRELSSFKDFLLYSSLVSLFGAGTVFLLLIVLSQHIVKPVYEAYEKQKRFITDAGHELKTPLTIIRADTDVLEMDIGENEWLRNMRNQTKRLTELTNHLVFLARMEEQPHFEKTEFSFSDIAKDAIKDFELLAKNKQIHLSASIEPNLMMRGEKDNIRRLIHIFLDNAVKYTNKNGSIQLTANKWHNQIRLQVYNTTNDISKETISHLFDRFYRTDKSRNSKTGGFGLGLSIAEAIAASHNGKVSAHTADEKSLTITATLPIV